MNATNTLKKQGSEKTFDYIYKDPDKNMPRSWIGRINLQKESSRHKER